MAKYLLGVEYSGSQLKIACFREKGRKYQLQFLGRLNIPDSFDKAFDEINSWKKEQFSESDEVFAVLTMPESLIYLKELELPKIHDSKIAETIRWELASATPIPAAEAVYEWRKIEESKDKIKVMAMVTKASQVEQFNELFEKAGISLLATEPSSLAFMRAIKADYKKTTLLMSVEEDETNLLVVKNASPVFTTSTSTPLMPEKDAKRKLKSSVVEELADNAKNIIKYYQETNGDMIMQVIIAGDVANRYYGLANAINKFAKIPVVIAKIRRTEKLGFSGIKDTELERYVIPLGAVYRLVTDDERVNLMPTNIKSKILKAKMQKKAASRLFFVTGVNLALLFLMLTTVVGLTLWEKSIEKEVRQTKQFVDNHPAQAYLGEVYTTNKKLGLIDILITQQKDSGERLRKIAELTPRLVVFDSVDFSNLKDEEWKIKGVGNRDDILAFYEKVKAEAGAKNVSMPYSNFSKESDNEFEISIIW
jgi:Tfp pilus assembly PilM family ATPase